MLTRPKMLNWRQASFENEGPAKAPPSENADALANVQLHSKIVASAVHESVRLLAAVRQAKHPS
jgi:hypothetical protein